MTLKIVLVLAIVAGCHKLGAGQVLPSAAAAAQVPGAGPTQEISPLVAAPTVSGPLPAAPAESPTQAVTPLGGAPTVSPLLPAAPVPENVTEELEPFNAIQVCLPFNIAISPGPPGNYSAVAVGEASVLDAISFEVVNGTLQLSTDGDFNTTGAVKVAVFLPEDALETLVVSSVGEVTVLPGFSAPEFTVSSAFGTGDINVIGFDTPALDVESSGTGRIIINGTIGDANVTASGTSTVYILTVNGTATVNLAGTASVGINSESNSVVINGQASGVNTVAYRRGICNVQSPFLGVFTPCTLVRSLSVPAIQPLWSCGLAVQGNFTCLAGGAAAVRQGATAGVGVAAAQPPTAAAPVTSVQPLATPTPSPTPSILPSLQGISSGVGGQQVISTGPGNQNAVSIGSGNQAAFSMGTDSARSVASSNGRKLRQAFASAGGFGAGAGTGFGNVFGNGNFPFGNGAFAGPGNGAFAGTGTGASAFANAGPSAFTTNTLPVGSSITTGLNQAILQSLQCNVDIGELNVLTTGM